MANLYITEFAFAGGGANPLQIGQQPPIASQVVAIGGASTQSAALNGRTTFVRLESDVVCSVVFGANPVATTNDMRMAADQAEYFGVQGGLKIAVISNT